MLISGAAQHAVGAAAGWGRLLQQQDLINLMVIAPYLTAAPTTTLKYDPLPTQTDDSVTPPTKKFCATPLLLSEGSQVNSGLPLQPPTILGDHLGSS